MNVNSASLGVVAVNKTQYPNDTRPEVAFVGRSNVGKSSLINTLVNRKKLARTSSDPGKTRTINFYNIDEKLYFVDLPGYGYAKISKSEREKWTTMIESYLKTREQLTCIIMLVDVRHEPTKNDVMMFEWLKYFNYNTIVVCTKADKLSKNELKKNIAIVKKVFMLSDDDNIIPFSSINKLGKEEILDLIDKYCKNPEKI